VEEIEAKKKYIYRKQPVRQDKWTGKKKNKLEGGASTKPAADVFLPTSVRGKN
jgi:hypothetical protein